MRQVTGHEAAALVAPPTDPLICVPLERFIG